MATLSLTYQGSYFPYVIVRRQSDNYVWNGSTFAAWSDGSIASYDVPLTSDSGDLWTVDFPSAISADDYYVVYYEALSSGTPATTDLLLLMERVHWTGSGLEDDDSDVALSDFALTTLTGVKRHMRITSNGDDTLLTELINQVSAKIESICGRRFKARDYRKWLNPHGERRLVLPDSPCQYITRMAYGSIAGMSVSYSGAAIRANVSVYVDPENAAAGGIRLVTYSTAGAATTSTLTFTIYPTMALMAAAISAVSGWTATASKTTTSFDLRPSGGVNVKTNATILYCVYWDIDQYRADLPRGVVSFDAFSWPNGWDVAGNEFKSFHQDLLIEYRAGYETIPADVDLIARELVKESYFAGKQNTGIKSSSLGPYKVEFNTDQEEMVMKRLAGYMDVGALIGGTA